MSLAWSRSWSFAGSTAAWFVGALFLVAGLVLGVAAPGWILGTGGSPPPTETREAVVLFRVLGWSLGALGAVILALRGAGVWLGRRGASPTGGHEWVGFAGGLMGALLFAVPAALALPFLLVVRSLAPGPLFAGLGRSSRDLWIGGLFSLAGIAILSILWLWRGERWLASRGRPAGRRKPESRE